ncbi:MAG: hypothetical protein IJT36_02365 [Alphaproteobacteria bacterium]|nr:hypothetical protein [Alphaproteobacteria bacterium]
MSLRSGLCCKENRRNGSCYHKGSRKGSTHRYNKGGILIEFALSIPILISLLLFVFDHYRFYELKDKIKSSTYLAASIMQQLSNSREDKQLTQNDLKRITFASCLNLFHSNSMCYPWPLGIYPVIEWLYAKRLSDDSYQWQSSWTAISTATEKGNSLDDFLGYSIGSVTIKTKSQIFSIFPDLTCSRDGDERILIRYWYRRSWKNYSKNKLGFFLLEPQIVPGQEWIKDLFTYRLIIVPKPGLFPAKQE